MDLKKLKDVVLEILQENKKARTDDFMLYANVLKKMRCPQNMPLKVFLVTAKSMKMPIFESVTRCRRKIQQDHPELAVKKISELRNKNQQKYKEFAKEKC